MKAEPAVKARRPQWQKTISYSKLVLHPWGLASLAALIALGLLEFRSPAARTFFGHYPVTIGLMAGLLNLIFTLSVVNRVIQRRDELRWRDIKNITLKGLNDEVRSTRDTLWIALFGRPPFGVKEQTEAACTVAQPQQSGVRWPDDIFGDAGKQIEKMISDVHWTQTAAKILRLATEQIREGLVRWAPLMALARGDYRVLGPVTTLADVLEAMEYPFAGKRTDNGTSPIGEQYRAPLRALWLHAITASVYAEENIVRTLYPAHEYPERGPKPWTSDQPRELMLSGGQREELDRWLGPPLRFWLRHPRKSWREDPLAFWLGHPLAFWLGHPRQWWLAHTRSFENDTYDRKHELTRQLDWPW